MSCRHCESPAFFPTAFFSLRWSLARRSFIAPFIVAAIFSSAPLVIGQVNPGTPNFAAFDQHAYDTINLQNLNIILNVPLLSKSGAFPFNLAMNGNYYCYVMSSPVQWSCGQTTPYVLVDGEINVGGRTAGAFPTVQSAAYCSGGGQFTIKLSGWLIAEGNQTIHPLPVNDYVDTYGCFQSTLTATATDDSGFSLYIPNSANGTQFPMTVYAPSGMSYAGLYEGNPGAPYGFTSMSDTANSPNTVTLNRTSVTDTLGYDAVDFNTNDTVFSWKDISATSSDDQSITLNTSSTNIATNFGCSGIGDGTSLAPGMLNSITMPTGTLFITYEPTYNRSGYVTGRLQELTLPTGGAIQYAYSGGNHGINCTYQVPPTLTRTTSDGTTTYTWAAISGGNTTTVTDNGGNKTVYQFIAGLLTQVLHYQGTSTLLTTDVYCYNAATGQPGNCATASTTPPVFETDIYHTINGMSHSSRMQTDRNGYGNVTYSAQYDFGASSPTIATSTIYGTWNGTACVAISATINNKPCDILMKEGANNVAETRYSYDSDGNLLTTYRWNGSSWLSSPTANVYNANGTVATAYDLDGNPTSYLYNGTGGCDNLFPTSVSAGGLTTHKTWNCTGGVVLTSADASGNVTTYGYVNSGGTPDPYWRVTSVTDPLGNVAWQTYPTASSPDTVSSSFTFNSGASIQNPTVTTDGYARKITAQKQQGPSSSNYDTVTTAYGWFGNYRKVSTSQPCTTTAGGTCTTVHSNYIDPLGRPYQETTTSNETLTYTYLQNDVLSVLSPAPAGENVKQVQNQYDGLGRLQYSCGIGNGSTTACGQNTGSANGVTTSYSYSSPAAGSTKVSATRGVQTRSTTYDGMGRVTSRSTPEGGTVTSVYDTVPSGCSGSAAAYAGKLIYQGFANGSYSCYEYDSLGRVTAITGSTASGVGVCRRFYYDNSSGVLGSLPSGVTLANQYGRMVEAETDNCTFPVTSSTMITDEWFSYDKDGHLTDIWQSTPHSGMYYHSIATYAGNGAVLTLQLANVTPVETSTYTLDGEGRWATLNNYGQTIVSSSTLNAAGQPLTINIGTHGDQDAYQYDPNTGRMTNWTFTVGTASETGTLTWNPIGSLRTLAITDGFNAGGTQTCNFGTSSTAGYDDLGRILSDNCGSTWAQTFSYDQYDNLTKAGSISWNPVYSSSNNHYSTGATYDASGNLLTDPFHTYTWDSFGKVSTVDSSACGSSGECVTYDALGHAVEISSGSAYTEIWYTQLGKTAYMSGNTVSYAYWPTPGGGTLLQTHPSGGDNNYFEHKDWLGNARVSSGLVTAIIDDRAFAPYGEMYQNFGSTAANELIFTGDTQDIVTGTYDTPNRELNPNQGRWLSPDPAGSGWNPYAYVTNPNSETDPTGLYCDLQDAAEGCGQGGFFNEAGPGGGVPSQSCWSGCDSQFGWAPGGSVGSYGGSVGADGGTVSAGTNAYFDSLNGTQGDVTQERDDSEPFNFNPDDLGPGLNIGVPCSGPGVPCHMSLVTTNPLFSAVFTHGIIIEGWRWTYQVTDVNENAVTDPMTILENVINAATGLPFDNSAFNVNVPYLSVDGTYPDEIGVGCSECSSALLSIWSVQTFSVQLNGLTYNLGTTIYQFGGIAPGSLPYGFPATVVP